MSLLHKQAPKRHGNSHIVESDAIHRTGNLLVHIIYVLGIILIIYISMITLELLERTCLGGQHAPVILNLEGVNSHVYYILQDKGKPLFTGVLHEFHANL